MRHGFNKFLQRKHLKHKDIAQALNVSIGLVGNYAAGRNMPSYENIVKLIELGMTAGELFGDEVAEKLRENELTYAPADILKLVDERIAQALGGLIHK